MKTDQNTKLEFKINEPGLHGMNMTCPVWAFFN